MRNILYLRLALPVLAVISVGIVTLSYNALIGSINADNLATTPVMSSIDQDDAITQLEERITAQDEEIILLRAELELIAQVTAQAVSASPSVVRVNHIPVVPDYGPQIAALSSQIADLAVRPSASVEIIGYDDLLRRITQLENPTDEDSIWHQIGVINQDIRSLKRLSTTNSDDISAIQSSYQELDKAIEQLSDLVGNPQFLPARDPFRVASGDNVIQHDTIIHWILTATELINWIHKEYGRAHRALGLEVEQEYPIKQQ